MAFFRSGCAFIGSLIALAVLTAIGAVFGTVIPLFIASSQGGPSFSLNDVQLPTTGTLVGGGIGVVLGLLVMMNMLRRASDINWLKAHGQRITAIVQKIDKRNTSTQVGNSTQYSTYYIVVANWTHPQTGRNYTFRSDQRSFKPRYSPGAPIPVLIDPSNPGRYFVEV